MFFRCECATRFAPSSTPNIGVAFFARAFLIAGTIAFESELGAFGLSQIARMTGGTYRFVP
jgi:hypothetical protein